MEGSRLEKILDYFPILAYFGFWVQGALIGAIITGEPKLIALGFVTAPAIAAMIIAIIKIRRAQNEQTDHA